MFFLGLGTAVPSKRFTQHELWEAFRASPEFSRLTSRSQGLMRTVLTKDNGLRTRYLALEDPRRSFEISPDGLHQRFIQNAPGLGDAASRAALAQASCRVEDIDAILISTCTGYLCPGLTSYLVESLGLDPKVLTFDLVGQGCGAAIPNLAAASALIQSGRASRVLSVCVEICSAALYLDDDPGVLISNCLFADGAAAVVLGAEAPPDRPCVKWCRSSSMTEPEHRGVLRFEHRNGLLRNILRPEVPKHAANAVAQVLHHDLDAAGLDQAQINGWLIHPGGRLVLESIGDRLGLRNGELSWSRDILRDYGNLSSPSVLFVLKHAMEQKAAGGWWWMSTFGAGFSCHGALLQVGTRNGNPD